MSLALADPVTAPPCRPAPAPRSFLRPVADRPADLDDDTAGRFAIAADLLDKLLTGASGPVRVLDVGCNVLDLWLRYLDASRVRVTRCDTIDLREENYVRVVAGEPLPFADESFDAVVSLEVLEHIPTDGRAYFLSECLRVSKRGCVWTCPNGDPAVAAAERIAAAAYERRNGRPHPFLREHVEFGLPTEAEIRSHLTALDVPHAVWRQNPLDRWLTSILLSEPLAESVAAPWLGRATAKAVAATRGGHPVCYRQAFVATKTFDATAALDESATTRGHIIRPDGDADSPSSDDSLAPAVAGAVGLALTNVARGWERELDQYRNEFDAERARWDDERGAVHRELNAARVRMAVLTNVVSRSTASVSWKLAAPIRALGRVLTPPRFEERGLLATHELKPRDDGEWESVGNDPQFVLPVLLPAGYVRIEIGLDGPAYGVTDVFADFGEGFSAGTCLDSFEWDEALTVDLVLKLPKPVFGLRIDPLAAKGRFRLRYARASALTGPRAMVHAFRKKIELLRQYRRTGPTIWNGLKMLATGRLPSVYGKLFKTFDDDRKLGKAALSSRTSYDVWRRRRRMTERERERQRAESLAHANPVTFSVVMPVHNPPPECLDRAIRSVRNQTYPHWQLCIVDDASTDPRVRKLLDEHAAADARIHVQYAPTNGGISRASNRALDAATGEYVALLDHDDEYAEQALFALAGAIRTNPRAEYVYSDEDKLDPDGHHVGPFFKPDWSPDFFLSCMYTCHVSCFRREAVERAGRFRPEFDTAQDYDLALRIVADIQNDAMAGGLNEETRIAHVPDVLYHWRMLPTSTAFSHKAKPLAEATAQRAIASYLERVGKPGTVERGCAIGMTRVRYRLRSRPRVSIVIPTAGRRVTVRGTETWFVSHCVRSIRQKSTYGDLEIVVVDNDDLEPALAAELDALGVVRVAFTAPFNLSEKINLGAERATGEYLILLNDDTEVIAPDWVEAMLEVGQWPEVGAVGAKLLFENGRLQHAGVTFLGPLPGHHFYGAPGDDPGYVNGNLLVRNYSAVTGACCLVRKADYRAVGGFDPSFPLNYNDIDFCLKLRRRGQRIVYQPYAVLTHFEGVSKSGVYPEEIERFVAKWKAEFRCDPFYNPNLSHYHGDYRLGTGEVFGERPVCAGR